MDGWGHGNHPAADAIYQANTPFVKSLYAKYPNTELITHGEAVGLPEGQMGNSEVGHMNLGAGRVVYQELQRINNAVRDGQLKSNPILNDTFRYCKDNNKALHLMGLVSNGGVHSSDKHLHALIEYAHQAGVKKIYVHAFTDGRDTDPMSGLSFLEELEAVCKRLGGELVSVVGRYYAMDRDNRWERVKRAYDLLVRGVGVPTTNIIEAVKASYHANITDEFIEPISLTVNGVPHGKMQPDDAVICFNFRTDRCREITKALTQQDFPEHGMLKMDLHYVTMTIYDHTFKNVANIFANEDLTMTLGEVLEKNNKTQLRVAETEKYPHVTFFFSGGREKVFTGESRAMVPSPKVATYDLQPEMSAVDVKSAVIKHIKSDEPDFICLNFANPDMVGHTGVPASIIKAVETVDKCVDEVVKAALAKGYVVLLTADHGNADMMINPDGSPNTAHTTNPVPLFYIEDGTPYKLKPGKLADVAPTVLFLMGIEKPATMTGENLIQYEPTPYIL